MHKLNYAIVMVVLPIHLNLSNIFASFEKVKKVKQALFTNSFLCPILNPD